MEKNTILAVVLSTILLIATFAVQGYFASRQQASVAQNQGTGASEQTDKTAPVQEQVSEVEQILRNPAAQPMLPSEEDETTASVIAQEEQIPLMPPIVVKTELYTAVLTNSGGDMISFKWRDDRKSENDPDAYVELILPDSQTRTTRAFSVAFDDLPVNSNFHITPNTSEYTVEFFREFSMPASVYGAAGKYKLTKRYEFIPDEYMFQLKIILEGGASVQGFNFGKYRAGSGVALSDIGYTLSFGPQIGPPFKKLDGHYDYRHYYKYTNGKRRNVKANEIVEDISTWASISGKYFTLIARPLQHCRMEFTETPEPNLASASRLNIIRPAANIPKIEDTYHFYIGPKTSEALSAYNNNSKNSFGLSGMNFNEVTNTRGFWGIFSPLEKLLKWLLLGIQGIVSNYGVAIILLTLLIKILFFPLTKKGSEATLRMQALGPKIKELQDKYKGNPQKLQAEMANFYKQEGYNPLSGCLPMLLQIPIFIAMFSLFNNHFQLRGAMFIPGWIPDLSLPEYIIQFENFRVPILGWTALRALPFIYVASQLLYGKVTQMPGQQSNTQMKLMLYIMPIVFFFVLYDVPSGLLIYWIFSNLLTLVQQVIINKFVIAKRKAQEQALAQTQSEKPPVIAPRSGGGKKKKRNH
ncbi:MAG: membrane protein insertase YidC [Treponema sp.]|nr:membrane protein insertase YidC [Treponema sp.]